MQDIHLAKELAYATPKMKHMEDVGNFLFTMISFSIWDLEKLKIYSCTVYELWLLFYNILTLKTSYIWRIKYALFIFYNTPTIIVVDEKMCFNKLYVFKITDYKSYVAYHREKVNHGRKKNQNGNY